MLKLPKKICEWFGGHRWNSFTYFEFKLKSGKRVRREIIVHHCLRCGTRKVMSTGPWVNV